MTPYSPTRRRLLMFLRISAPWRTCSASRPAAGLPPMNAAVLDSSGPAAGRSGGKRTRSCRPHDQPHREIPVRDRVGKPKMAGGPTVQRRLSQGSRAVAAPDSGVLWVFRSTFRQAGDKFDVTFAGPTTTSLSARRRKAIRAATDPLSIFAGKPCPRRRSRLGPYLG